MTQFFRPFLTQTTIPGSHTSKLPASGPQVIANTQAQHIQTADQLNLKINENILCYFVEEDLRVRRLNITGLYNTCMSEMDRMFVLGSIDVIRQLNGWNSMQASGIEVLVDDLKNLQEA